jgi:hypothetical protein
MATAESSAESRAGARVEARAAADLAFAPHEVRLTGRQWLLVAAVSAAFFALAPAFWSRFEPFTPGPDYRMPYALSSDYWQFSRYCRWAESQRKTVLLGDSMVWGQYVAQDGTLSHYLNELAGDDHFANLGLDGAHPAALAGLLEHYAGAIQGCKVIVQCNPLWMSSEKSDLTSKEESRFNHPRLVPQFVPAIPCYKEPWSGRLNIVIERQVPFFAWTQHLQAAYFDQMDAASWTLAHPYRDPVTALGRPATTAPDPNPPAVPWTQRGITAQDFAWVEARDSFQWRSFQELLRVLKRRHNEVFVLVGPFNEHMLTPASLARYDVLKAQILAGLRAEGVPCCAPEALPSELYADASHPLKQGYALLAKELFACDAFAPFRSR